MAKNQETVKVTYDHAVDSMKKTKENLPRAWPVQPNASLTEAVDAVGNPNRLQIGYSVGKNPQEKYVSPGTIEDMRPPKSEFKNG